MIMLDPILMFAASCSSGVGGLLCSPITGWFPFASLGVLVIMLIASLIYGLSPIMGRSEMRTWARLKMYETLFSFLLVIIFSGFALMVYTINPIPLFTNLNLVPGAGSVAAGIPAVWGVHSDCTQVTDIYGLSECDLFNFNSNIVYYLNNVIGGATILFSSTPSFQLKYSFNPAISNFGLSLGLTLDSLPIAEFLEGSTLAIGSLIILSQVQLLLLDAAMLIFAILLPLGLVARIFGITRSFGGAMIAFALGIGLIFPIMVSITYGFLVQVLSVLAVQPAINAINAVALLSDPTGPVLAIVNSVFEWLGIALAGTLVLPLITFTIVNTFIIDFSQAVGERMDFLSLLTSVA
ncbi:MAG: hypothetical protein KGH65_01560 [Candidatus Micrarchaeota archaeon]|nr:hypothetical protein [Candidatus Micrarchaeota archaeon]